MRSRRHDITLLAALAIAGGAGCERRKTPADSIVVVIDAPMTTADARFAVSNLDSKLVRLVGAGLTAVDTPTVEPRLDLAERIDLLSPTLIDVTLRDGLKFSDGSPLTAADVDRTMNSVLAEGSKSLSHKGFKERFVAIRATNPRVVRFELTAPTADFTSFIDFAVMSETGKGAGPYTLRELTSTHALLDVNPHYHGAAPLMPHVEIKFVRDAAARLLMMVGGSADLIQNGVRLDLLDQIEARPGVRLESAPSVILTYLMMNNSDPILKDVRVRQAIAYALDRPALITAKLNGYARRATGLLPAMHWAYEGDVRDYPHDRARAMALLDAAGFKDPDGPGPRPRFTLSYKTSSDAFRVSLARVLAAQLAAVGIEVEVRSFEFATFFADVKKGIYQIASMQTAELTEPDYFHTYFHSARIPSKANPDGGNRWLYRNARVDALTEEGRRTLVPAQRKVLYGEVQRILAEDVPIVPLWHEDNVVLVRDDISGYRMTPNARLIGLTSTVKTR